MLGKIALVLLLGIAVFLGYVATRPDDFRIVRTTTIAAPAAIVFSQVDDFHNWEEWSPWAKLDPDCKNTFEGASSGTGAVFAWDGNDKVGAGKMTILESRANELIKIKLEFFRPMEGVNTTEFTFKPEGGKTLVTWDMSGTYKTFFPKVICTLMNMDKVVGTQFEQGLTKLKSVAEAAKKSPSADR